MTHTFSLPSDHVTMGRMTNWAFSWRRPLWMTDSSWRISESTRSPSSTSFHVLFLSLRVLRKELCERRQIPD